MTRFSLFFVLTTLFCLSADMSNAAQRDNYTFAQQPIYICPMHSHIVKDHEGECPICGMDLVLKESSETAEEPAMSRPASMVSYICPMHSHIVKDHEGECPICGMDLVLKESSEIAEEPAMRRPASMVSYICPMHSHIVQDHEGECPICGMDLVEKVNEPSQVVQVNVSGAMQQAMSVKTETVQRSLLKTSIKTYGTVQFDETSLSHIHSRAPGWIEKLTVNSIGQQIKAGELLYEIYAPELLIAQEDFLSLLSSNSPQTLLERGRRRLQLLGFNNELIKQLEQNRQVFYRVPYYAQEDGVVSALNVREGMYAAPADRIMTVANLSSVWVIADIFEHQTDSIEVGQDISLDLPALDILGYEGQIEFIYPTLDPITKTLRVRVILENPEEQLKPDMLGEIEIFTRNIETLNINKTALIQTEKQNRVIVQNDKGGFEIRTVQLGIANDERVQVKQGLSVGEKVVTSGQFLLDAEASLQNIFTQSQDHNH